jgi:hypothetical protein
VVSNLDVPSVVYRPYLGRGSSFFLPSTSAPARWTSATLFQRAHSSLCTFDRRTRCVNVYRSALTNAFLHPRSPTTFSEAPRIRSRLHGALDADIHCPRTAAAVRRADAIYSRHDKVYRQRGPAAIRTINISNGLRHVKPPFPPDKVQPRRIRIAYRLSFRLWTHCTPLKHHTLQPRSEYGSTVGYGFCSRTPSSVADGMATLQLRRAGVPGAAVLWR